MGRLAAVKGARFAIEAMRACQSEQLIIVGDGPERAALERTAHGLPNVSFVGMVSPDAVQRYLARARVLVVPSLDEGQPNAIMEAMALGVPVIASRVGAVPDLVKDGETGFLVEPRDSEAIARRIRMVATDPSLRARLSANCLTIMEKYRWPAVIETLQHELRQAASCTPGRPGIMRRSTPPW